MRAPDRRVHVMLPLCANVRAVLSAALCPANGLGDAALRCGLSRAARLVELSAMVVLPGAEAQAAHTDVPPHTVQRMATLWVALQDVDRTLGPTMVYASDPAELAARVDWAALQREAACHTVSACVVCLLLRARLKRLRGFCRMKPPSRRTTQKALQKKSHSTCTALVAQRDSRRQARRHQRACQILALANQWRSRWVSAMQC